MGGLHKLPGRDGEDELEYGLFEPTVRGDWIAPVPSSREPFYRGPFALSVLELSRKTDWTLIRVWRNERWESLTPEGYRQVRQEIERHVTARRAGEYESARKLWREAPGRRLDPGSGRAERYEMRLATGTGWVVNPLGRRSPCGRPITARSRGF